MPPVNIVVVTTDNLPIQGAQVTIEGIGTQPTDPNGIAAFPAVPIGDHRVIVAPPNLYWGPLPVPAGMIHILPPPPGVPPNSTGYAPQTREAMLNVPDTVNLVQRRFTPIQYIYGAGTREATLEDLTRRVENLQRQVTNYSTLVGNPAIPLGELRRVQSEIETQINNINDIIRTTTVNTTHPLFNQYQQLLQNFNAQDQAFRTARQTAEQRRAAAGGAPVEGRPRGTALGRTPRPREAWRNFTSRWQLRLGIGAVLGLLFGLGLGLTLHWGVGLLSGILVFVLSLFINPRQALSQEWLRQNWLRLVLSAVITIVGFVVLYEPFFSALGQSNIIFWLLIPLLTFFISFFLIPQPDLRRDPGPLLMGFLLGIATFFGLWFAPNLEPAAGFLRARYFISLIPLGVFLITWKMARGQGGMGKTLLSVGGVLLLVGFLVMFISLGKAGKLTQIETYLKTLDVLKLVGVPADTVESMKSGVRSTLSFLQFKGAQPTTPEAKKIGGFEAIQLKFGSRFNNFALPTLFARMDYTVPVTVINPNKFDTKLVVEKFKIEDVFMNNGSSRIICGSTTKELGLGDPRRTATVTTVPTGLFDLGDINPEEDKLATIEFKGKTTQNNDVPNVVLAVGDKVDCRDVLDEYRDPRPVNPMSVAKVRKSMSEDDAKEICTEPAKDNACKDILNDFYDKYLPGIRATSDDITAIFTSSDGGVCECKLSQYFNIMDKLCFFDNDKTGVTLKSSYDFKVQGKGELILVKAEVDRKLSPRPTITSSAGPLTITTYFISDTHVFAKNAPKTTKMFIQIQNDGDGSAKINGMRINGKVVPGELPVQLLDTDKIKITKCLPDPSRLTIGKETISAVCDIVFNVGENEISSVVTGSYRTLPVIVDIGYTYSQTHSTTINVKKETIPEGVTETDQIRELDTQFKPLPYYCPNEKSATGPLIIFNPEAVRLPKPCDQMGEQECKQNTAKCIWVDPVLTQPGKCVK